MRRASIERQSLAARACPPRTTSAPRRGCRRGRRARPAARLSTAASTAAFSPAASNATSRPPLRHIADRAPFTPVFGREHLRAQRARRLQAMRPAARGRSRTARAPGSRATCRSRRPIGPQPKTPTRAPVRRCARSTRVHAPRPAAPAWRRPPPSSGRAAGPGSARARPPTRPARRRARRRRRSGRTGTGSVAIDAGSQPPHGDAGSTATRPAVFGRRHRTRGPARTAASRAPRRSRPPRTSAGPSRTRPPRPRAPAPRPARARPLLVVEAKVRSTVKSPDAHRAARSGRKSRARC